jgi:hypothetical protein
MVTHPGPTWQNQNFATEVTGHMGCQLIYLVQYETHLPEDEDVGILRH